MNELLYEITRSFINASPFILLILIAFIALRKSFYKFISRNLIDAGSDRYDSAGKDVTSEEKLIAEEQLKKHVREILLSEVGSEGFSEYKDNLNKLIEFKQGEITKDVLSKANSEKEIEDAIAASIKASVEKVTDKLMRNDGRFQDLEVKTLERLNLIKTSSFLEHLEKEYNATRSTKALMSNMFIFVNFIYFFGLLGVLVARQVSEGVVTPPAIYMAVSFSYIGLGAFVVYMIKFCNARSLTLLSLREDFLKREQVNSMATKMVELGTNEHHVALLQLINSSVATKEQKINHPYEMLLYGIKDSNIMFKGGKFEVRKEASSKGS